MLPAGHVVIVEDDEATRQMVAALVAADGFRVHVAEDGLEALHLLRAVRHAASQVPCLVLLDLTMPRLGGAAFRRAQLKDPIVAGVPIAIMTGAMNADHEAADLGAVAMLKKPLDVGELVDTVRRYCRQS